MVSFDIISLYTNIHIYEAIEVINCITNPDTTKLVEICLTSTFFSFEGELYEQTCGVEMGSPLTPTVANLFMEDFEYEVLASTQFQPEVWKRFVDDTFILWLHGHEKLDLCFSISTIN